MVNEHFFQNMVKFQEDLTQRQDKARYSQYGSSIQPFMTFVGEDIQSIHTLLPTILAF